MKITKVEILHIKDTFKLVHWRPILIRVHTDSGIYGDGEAALAYGEADFAAVGMLQNLSKLIIGMDPLQHEIIWDKLYRSIFWGLNGGPVIFAGISAIDIALWDIKGKHYGAPIHELLGGKRNNALRTYASQLQFGWQIEDVTPQYSDEDYAEVAKKAVAEGYDCLKYDFFTYKPEGGRYTREEKKGQLPQRYVNMMVGRVKAIREAIGPDVDIIMENHSTTDTESCVKLVNALKPYGIFLVEEPSVPTPELSARVHLETGLPVANGERIYTRWQYIEYFKKNAIQVIQPDIGTCGGITEVKKICDMAHVFDIGVQVHACGSPICTAAAIQLESAIPNFVIHEHHTYGTSEAVKMLCKYDYQPVNGLFAVPDLPGLGQEISQKAFEHCDLTVVG